MKLQTVYVLVSVVLVVVKCQVLNFTKQLTPDDISCGHLRCVVNSSLNIINIAIYNTTEKDKSVKLASISVFAPDVIVDPSQVNVINATGTISKYEGVLNISFLGDVDCLHGEFQCELDFVNINGQPDVIREDLAPAAEAKPDICNSLAEISAQLKDTNTQLEGLQQDNEVLKKDNEILKQDIGVIKQDNEVLKKDNEILKQDIGVLKQDNEVLKQDNDVLKTMLGSVLVELSSIKGMLNSTLDNDQKNGSSCYRGMPHKSPRERFVLPGNIQALCDTETDGGGWVIIQRRVRGDVDFYKGWDDYKKGFGTPDTDFWIGNDIIHNLTSQGYSELRIDFIYNGTEFFAQYTNFDVADESSEYLITIGGFSGNVYNSMNYHNGNTFSTFDRDNHACAVSYHGAWWYDHCYLANLNAAWGVTGSQGISWHGTYDDKWTNLSFTEMKIRHF